MVKYQAVGDRVFVRLTEEKNSAGILLPDNAERPRTTGVVESVGHNVRLVKTGDKILFHVFDELPSPDADVVVVRECSVLGVWEDE